MNMIIAGLHEWEITVTFFPHRALRWLSDIHDGSPAENPNWSVSDRPIEHREDNKRRFKSKSISFRFIYCCVSWTVNPEVTSSILTESFSRHCVWHGTRCDQFKSFTVGSDINALIPTPCSCVSLQLPHISAVICSNACALSESVHIHFVLVGVKLCRSQRAGGWLSNRRRRQAAWRWSGKKRFWSK